MKTEEYLKVSIPNSFKLDENGKRVDTFGSMFVAIREGLINMLMHADYYGDTSIQLDEYPTNFKFRNPGKMKIPSGDFFTTNKSVNRNSIISKLFLQVGYGERAGHGGERIYESSSINKFRAPEIKTDLHGTELTIWKVDYAQSFSGHDITDKEREVIKAIINSVSWSLSRKEIEAATGFSRYYTDHTLSNLIQKKIIVRSGSNRATKYAILPTNEQLIAQAQMMPDLIRNILKHGKSDN